MLVILTSSVPNPQTPKPGDWGCHYNAVIPFDHPANQIDQVDSEIKDRGAVLHNEVKPITFWSGGRQVSMSILITLDS